MFTLIGITFCFDFDYLKFYPHKYTYTLFTRVTQKRRGAKTTVKRDLTEGPFWSLPFTFEVIFFRFDKHANYNNNESLVRFTRHYVTHINNEFSVSDTCNVLRTVVIQVQTYYNIDVTCAWNRVNCIFEYIIIYMAAKSQTV